MWLRAVVTLLVPAALLSACGSARTNRTTSAAVALPAGHAKPSVVQGVPVPDEAILVFDRGGQSQYQLDLPISAVNSWYDVQLPPGHPWRDWKPLSYLTGPQCPKVEGFKATGFSRVWTKGGCWSARCRMATQPTSKSRWCQLPSEGHPRAPHKHEMRHSQSPTTVGETPVDGVGACGHPSKRRPSSPHVRCPPERGKLRCRGGTTTIARQMLLRFDLLKRLCASSRSSL